MKIIGLTGRAAAGKNLFSEAFARCGCTVIDVDKVGHRVLEQSQAQLVQAFGADIVQKGSVDRTALGALVFSDAHKLAALEAITHPAMVDECKRLIQKAEEEGSPAVVINAALLFRMNLYQLCDHVVFVQASLCKRFFRSKRRDSITLKKFLARERAQKDIRPDVFPSSLPVYIFPNGSDKVLIHRQVREYCGTIGIGVSSS